MLIINFYSLVKNSYSSTSTCFDMLPTTSAQQSHNNPTIHNKSIKIEQVEQIESKLMTVIITVDARFITVVVMFADVDIYCRFSVVTFAVTVSTLAALLIIAVILLIVQHLRRKQAGQLQ